MNKIKKLYCRTFQTAFKLALPFLPYRKPEIVYSVKTLPESEIRSARSGKRTFQSLPATPTKKQTRSTLCRC